MIFDDTYVKRLIERQEQGRPLDFHLWTLMSFELWCRTFLDRTIGPVVPTAAAANPVGARPSMPRSMASWSTS
jgi:hypothetical protein